MRSRPRRPTHRLSPFGLVLALALTACADDPTTGPRPGSAGATSATSAPGEAGQSTATAPGDGTAATAPTAATPAGTAAETVAGSPSGADSGAGAAPPRGAAAYDVARPDVVARGLEVPWGLAFLPDGSALVSERESGRILQLRPGQQPLEVMRIPGVEPRGEGGLLGLAVSPAYARDGLVYAYLTAADDNRVVRFRLGGQPEVLVSGIAAASIHDGGRIAFDPDGFLVVATGDAGRSALAQDPGSLNGKILRLRPDGSPAPGNPGGGRIFSLGHRNVQGLAWDSAGRFFATELGQNTWDEVNLIQPGGNYGWPEVEGMGGDARFVDPLLTWSTAEASPSGAAIAGGHLYVAALRGERLWRVPLLDGRLGTPEPLLDDELGRLRTVAVAPDGWLWVTTSNRDGRGQPVGDDDRVVRFPPLPGSG